MFSVKSQEESFSERKQCNYSMLSDKKLITNTEYTVWYNFICMEYYKDINQNVNSFIADVLPGVGYEAWVKLIFPHMDNYPNTFLKRLLSTPTCFCTFVNTLLAISVQIYFWAFCSNPLIYIYLSLANTTLA